MSYDSEQKPDAFGDIRPIVGLFVQDIEDTLADELGVTPRSFEYPLLTAAIRVAIDEARFAPISPAHPIGDHRAIIARGVERFITDPNNGSDQGKVIINGASYHTWWIKCLPLNVRYYIESVTDYSPVAEGVGTIAVRRLITDPYRRYPSRQPPEGRIQVEASRFMPQSQLALIGQGILSLLRLN